jgi:predicted nucleic-acid-binding Zn-ribbon protein
MSESEVKKCPKCGEEMEIGYLPGAFSWSAGRSLWSIKNPLKIFAYRCKNCSYVEFYTEKKRQPTLRKI